MLFNSITFIIFFIYVLIFHYSNIAWQHKKTNLLFCSYIFYAAWSPPFVLLLFLSTFVDWHLAQKIYRSSSDKIRKKWLWLSIGFNLGMLSVFKYSGFFVGNFNSLMNVLNIEIDLLDPGFILPMGISFYTFQTLSYTLDIYFKKLKPHHGFKDYALFVSFFPQLVAGPIVRAKKFLPQLKQQNHISFNTFSIGISLFILGIFEKTVLADAFFAPIVNQVFIDNSQPDLLSSWLAALFFYGQIFCDFSGYSLCAIGAALCLGFSFSFNFKSPFAAVGFSDFWRRWHISLSSWLRDYLYIPLGGNRYGSFTTFKNLMITMLLGGLWHGAAWTFVLWGFVHGLYLAVERWFKTFKFSQHIATKTYVRVILMFMTFFFIMVTFIIFRAENIEQMLMIFKAMLGFIDGKSIVKWNLWNQIVLGSFVILFAIQWFYKNHVISEVLHMMSATSRALLLSVCMILIFISSGNSNAFIYFQF